MIARQKDSGFGWKLEDFEFRAAFTIIQHFHFFYKKYYKKYEMVELKVLKITNASLALNMLFVFSIFQI
jgi:hypothetical protein